MLVCSDPKHGHCMTNTKKNNQHLQAKTHKKIMHHTFGIAWQSPGPQKMGGIYIAMTPVTTQTPHLVFFTPGGRVWDGHIEIEASTGKQNIWLGVSTHSKKILQ